VLQWPIVRVSSYGDRRSILVSMASVTGACRIYIARRCSPPEPRSVCSARRGWQLAHDILQARNVDDQSDDAVGRRDGTRHRRSTGDGDATCWRQVRREREVAAGKMRLASLPATASHRSTPAATAASSRFASVFVACWSLARRDCLTDNVVMGDVDVTNMTTPTSRESHCRCVDVLVAP